MVQWYSGFRVCAVRAWLRHVAGVVVHLPFVFLKDGHAKDCNDPAYDGNDNDADNYAHATAADGGENLAADDGINGAVANHENNVERAGSFGRPVAHKVATDDLKDCLALDVLESYLLCRDVKGNLPWSDYRSEDPR